MNGLKNIISLTPLVSNTVFDLRLPEKERTEMILARFILGIFVSGALGFSSPSIADQGSTDNSQKTKASAEQIRAALRSPNEEVFQTALGTLTIRHSNDETNTPGKLLLNGELIYTARQQEALPHFRGRPFNLRLISWDKRAGHISRMVIEERSWTCQYIVLDFTEFKVWLSKRFPEGFQNGECFGMTWVRWEKDIAYFYFGFGHEYWEKGKYLGWKEGYNPKLKAVFGGVDAPPPPKDGSLIPKPKPH